MKQIDFIRLQVDGLHSGLL